MIENEKRDENSLERTSSFSNPLSYRPLLLRPLFGIIIIVLGVAILLYPSLNEYIGIIVVLLGGLYLCSALWSALIHRPVSVSIDDDKAILKFRFLKERTLRWKEIRWVEAVPGSDGSPAGYVQRFGVIQPMNGSSYPVTYEIANEIVTRYQIKMGRRPLTRDEFYKGHDNPSENYGK